MYHCNQEAAKKLLVGHIMRSNSEHKSTHPPIA